MEDKNNEKILGFTKREPEILIMSLQVLMPNKIATNGCSAKPSDLVRIGAYEDAATAGSQYAALRAKVMALRSLPKCTDQADDGNNEDIKENKKRAHASTTREGSKRISARAGAARAGGAAREHDERERPTKKRRLGEGLIDEDLPNEKDWENMGHWKAC
ncbi:hypothetical protein Daus18300_006990 [Diaporthe australafricana]|uniref:Uncharacterized protein n=1 Tax=Diaporthe australafricana TaxID=127596 RepID=A0ABR3WQE1_9PEZI